MLLIYIYVKLFVKFGNDQTNCHKKCYGLNKSLVIICVNVDKMFPKPN